MPCRLPRYAHLLPIGRSLPNVMARLRSYIGFVRGLAGAVLVAGILAGSAAAQAQNSGGLMPVAVFGADDREVLPARLQAMREKIGVLFNIRQRSVCSAFCVDASTIGTAAHCLFKTAGEKTPRLADFWFARNYDSARDYARIAGHQSNAAAQNVLAGSYALSTTPPIDATRDWAFVRLSRPVCAKGGFEIEAASSEHLIREAKAGRIFQISYHKDFKQWQPAYSKPCQVERSFGKATWAQISADFSMPEHLLLHTCDTGGASSGSPLFIETPSGPKVVGINVGTYVQSKVLVPHQRAPNPVAADKGVAESIANTGVMATAFADQVRAFRAAQILSGIGPMRELQERLRTAGFYTGPMDVTYGPTLKKAIEAFEASLPVAPTGLASETVLSHLRLKQAGDRPKAAVR
jgi:Putative peptidoglycan binding domain